MAKTKKKKKDEEVVINLDNAGVPIAIIISGILIATVIFFASRNNTPVTTDTGETVDAETEQEASSTDEEFTTANVTLGNSPYIGDEDSAEVAVIEYNEYRCSFCLRHKDETLSSIIENYVDTGKVIYVFKEFAIYGDDIANASKCVYHLEDTETYVDFHNQAFNLEDDDAIYALAADVGVNESEFDACYSESRYQDEIDADKESGTSAGVQGTPGFVVGKIGEDGAVEGELIAGAYPYDTFVEAIESFLE